MMKKRMSDNQRKGASILIRVTLDELKLLSSAAKLNKLATSTHVRAVALKNAEKELKSA